MGIVSYIKEEMSCAGNGIPGDKSNMEGVALSKFRVILRYRWLINYI